MLVRTFLERDDGDLSEIRTCSDFGRLLYYDALASPDFGVLAGQKIASGFWHFPEFKRPDVGILL